MQRKRSELVPIAEAFSDLSGPVKSIRDATPQSLHHFTQADQVNQLVAAREADPDLGFMARMMALCSLPRTNPGNRLQYKRVNGPYTLYMTAGAAVNSLRQPAAPDLGLGVYRSRADPKPRAGPGCSLAEFMRALGIYSSAGSRKPGSATKWTGSFMPVQLIYEDEGNLGRQVRLWRTAPSFGGTSASPTSPHCGKARSNWEKFFNEIIRHPVPLDMNTLKALKRSPLGLDLYLWLVYRTFACFASATALLAAPVPPVRGGPVKDSDNHDTVQYFRKVLRELKKIKLAWPG